MSVSSPIEIAKMQNGGRRATVLGIWVKIEGMKVLTRTLNLQALLQQGLEGPIAMWRLSFLDGVKRRRYDLDV